MRFAHGLVWASLEVFLLFFEVVVWVGFRYDLELRV